MKITMVGTGYVGLVTGVALSHIGHHVTCIDIDEAKVVKMRQGISPIYEPGLEELMKENIQSRAFVCFLQQAIKRVLKMWMSFILRLVLLRKRMDPLI